MPVSRLVVVNDPAQSGSRAQSLPLPWAVIKECAQLSLKPSFRKRSGCQILAKFVNKSHKIAALDPDKLVRQPLDVGGQYRFSMICISRRRHILFEDAKRRCDQPDASTTKFCHSIIPRCSQNNGISRHLTDSGFGRFAFTV